MNEPFELPVTYKGEELNFPARLLQLGYTHRFMVELNGIEVAFEPDEERNYRALVDISLLERNKKLDIELLQVIANTLESIVR